MSIGLFKKSYTVRRHGPQEVIDGLTAAPYTDMTVRLDVQPLSSDELLALPEGDRTVRRVKSYGPDKLISANEFKGIPSDLLFYQGLWYECKSSVMWDHTMLRHYKSEFVILTESQQSNPPEGGGNP